MLCLSNVIPAKVFLVVFCFTPRFWITATTSVIVTAAPQAAAAAGARLRKPVSRALCGGHYTFCIETIQYSVMVWTASA